MTLNGKGKSISAHIYNFADRKLDKIDFVFMAVIFIICYACFIQGDILVTGNHSFIMQTNPLSFYDKCHEWSGMYSANYLPSTFILFAIWNLPLRLIGHVPAALLTNSLINMLWYKLLPVMFMIASAILIEKICRQMGMDKVKSKVAKYAFIMSPLTLFCLGIFGQYDIFTVFFILLGYYYYLKGNRGKFILFFGLAITFKYYALLYFVVLLLLKEKGILKIIRDIILVAIPTLIEIIIYLPSPAFKQSVFGFSALSYLDNSLNLGGLRGVNVFLLAMIILAVLAYVIKPKEDEKVQWSIFFANGVSFAFYGFVSFHPQWLLLCVPFMVLAVMRTRVSKILVIVQNILIIALYFLVVNAWSGNVDQQMMAYGALKKFVPSGWAVSMKDILSYDNEVYLFTAIFAILLLYMVFSHPKFAQQNLNVIEKDTVLNIRIAYIIAFLAWVIPAFVCLKVAMDGKFQMISDTESEQMTPVAMTEDTTIKQEFYNTADEIYSLKIRSGNYGHNNQVSLIVDFVNAETDICEYENTLTVNSVEADGWVELIEEPVELKKDTDYYLILKGSENADNCIAAFCEAGYIENRSLSINEQEQDGYLLLQIKGKNS